MRIRYLIKKSQFGSILYLCPASEDWESLMCARWGHRLAVNEGDEIEISSEPFASSEIRETWSAVAETEPLLGEDGDDYSHDCKWDVTTVNPHGEVTEGQEVDDWYRPMIDLFQDYPVLYFRLIPKAPLHDPEREGRI